MKTILLLVVTNIVLSLVVLKLGYREHYRQQHDPRNKFFAPPYVIVTEENGDVSIIPFRTISRIPGNTHVDLFRGMYKMGNYDEQTGIIHDP